MTTKNEGDNVAQLNTGNNENQGKQPKTFKDLVSTVTGEMAGARTKDAQGQVKAILQKKAEAEKLIRGYDEELAQLQAKFEKGLL